MTDKTWALPPLRVAPLTGDETLHRDGRATGATTLDFWRWSCSDLANNALRGVLAEWIVARALGAATGVRTEWDAYDLVSSAGTTVEVKSAAYLQSWGQNALSSIGFGIRPTRGLQENSNIYGASQRQAQIYVFCLLHHQDKATLDPLDLGQWTFYLLHARVLNEELGEQKTLTLSRLLQLAPRRVRWEELAAGVEALAANS